MNNAVGYNLLISKLDEFIRKYYKNQMIRGTIYCAALILGTYLTVTLLEYFGRFNITVRTLLFWTFIVSSAILVGRFFIWPLAKMFRLGQTISHEQAAAIIGKHFTDVQDKLLNTLQLKDEADKTRDNSLLEASIRQRIETLRPVPFSSAIDLRENRKYLKWVIPPVAIILVLLFAAPSVLTKPTDRLIRHGQIIVEEAPFKISVRNGSLSVAENDNITVDVEVSGAPVPDKVFLVLENQQYLLEKENNVTFHYTFRNVRQDTPFSFFADGFYSDPYEIKVIPTPRLVDFSVNLQYPSYTKRTNETIRNTGDLLVPAGTRINWEFRGQNTERLNILFSDSLYTLDGQDQFTFSQTAYQPLAYTLVAQNSYLISRDSITYRIQVIPDLHPSIIVDEARDSASLKQLYFSGEVKDDYGFKRLTFNYQFVPNEHSAKNSPVTSVEMPVSRENPMDEFFYDWNIGTLDVAPGDKIIYFFEVWDNDGVNGSKSTRSALREYVAPTEAELEAQLDQKNEDLKDKLEESMKDARKIQKELDELQRNLLEKKELNWQDKKKLEDLLKQQEELRKQVEQIQQQNEQKNNQQNEFQQPEQKILEKQQQLEQLMNQVMNPELQKMMEELQRLMEELNKDELQKQLEQLDLSNEDLEKELDRALEQFKQLEFEQKMEKTLDKLEKLSEKQDELSKESEKKETSPEDLKKQQDELNKEFDELKKEMDELEKMNEELENPNEVPDTEEQEKQIEQEQQNSSDQLQKNKKSNASKSQKSAAQKMKEMAQQMEMAMQSSEQEQQEENMEALRALLENIITLSFDQEALMANFQKTDINDPVYNKHGQTQRKLKDDAKMVEDSLFALSKRVAQIGAIVNREINLVNENMALALENIPDRKTPEVVSAQQSVMTSFNNLALLLDDALKQMQNQAASSKPGQGNCEKPGGSGSKPKPSAGDMKKMQESLSKQLEEMKKKGQNKGDGKGGQGEMSKQLAEMAAKQAAIRKLMEEKAGELNQDGSGNGNELKQIAKDMEQLQKDIVNNQIDENTLRRQQDIMIRLLKAENAERTRDQDNQRKSNEANDPPTSNPMKYEEYMKRKQRETELLKTVPPALKPYYKEKVNSYFNKLGNQ
jgi:hypothetical protein